MPAPDPPDPAVPQLQKMVHRQFHPLRVVGTDHEDTVQVPRRGVDADQRHDMALPPVRFETVVAQQRNGAAERKLFDQLQVFQRNRHRDEIVPFQLFSQTPRQRTEISPAARIRRNDRDLPTMFEPIPEAAGAIDDVPAGIPRNQARTGERAGYGGSGVSGFLRNPAQGRARGLFFVFIHAEV